MLLFPPRIPLVVLFVVSLLALLPSAAVRAQDAQGIAAIVNEDVISVHDLDSRVTLVLVTSKLDDTPENRRRLLPEVMRTLIDERLKRQEMRKQNITVAQNELDRALTQVAQQLRVEQNDLAIYLRQRGVPMATLLEQLEAEIGWIKAVQRLAGDRAVVSRREVDEELARVRSSGVEYRLAEIFLPIDDPANQARVEQQSLQLVTEARGGANFPALARTFSQGPSAAEGGDLGWVTREDLDEPIEKVVSQMQPGQVSDPIRGQGGYFILFLAGRRSGDAATSAGRVSMSMQQVFLPLPRTASQTEVAARVSTAQEIAQGSNDCAAFAERGRAAGAQVAASPNAVDVQQMPPELRQLVGPLQAGGVTQPIRTNDGVMVLMVCERQVEAGDDEQRAQIERRLRDQRLATTSRRQIRDLRRAALLDVRI
ncbi:MAG: peptidylprolyl isomerase [Rhodospirillales bacterium]|nr:peptidylprolyl isomerase [Rhodospirillales bacterium]